MLNSNICALHPHKIYITIREEHCDVRLVAYGYLSNSFLFHFRIPGKLPSVTFSSGEQILKDNKVAREHRLKLHSVKEMTLGVFSCTVRTFY